MEGFVKGSGDKTDLRYQTRTLFKVAGCFNISENFRQFVRNVQGVNKYGPNIKYS